MKINIPTFLASRRHSLLLLALAALLPVTSGHAATSAVVPSTMSFQGFLTDASGNPLGSSNTGPANYDVVLRLWDLQLGGATNSADELYAEQQTVTVNNGYFSVQLGQGSAYNTEPHSSHLASLFFTNSTASTARYLETTVLGIGPSGGNITITPRLACLASPYAYLAANALNAANLVNASNGVSSVSVSVNGYVGIGTSTPSQPLDVQGLMQVNTNGTIEVPGSKNTFQGMIETYYGGPNDRYGLGQFPNGITALYTSAAYGSSSIQFGLIEGTNSFSPSMTVTHDGSVGIGTTAPAYSLEVTGTVGCDSTLQVNGNATVGGPLLQVNNALTANGLASFSGGLSINSAAGYHQSSLGTFYVDSPGIVGGRVTVTTGGAVGIGTTTPAVPLDVEANGFASFGAGTYFDQTRTSVGGYTSASEYVAIKCVSGVLAQAFYAVSDQRIKDIVRRSDTGGDLQAIQKLHVTDYRMKDRVANSDTLHKGFIAQEVQQVIPEAVTKSQGFVPDIYAVADRIRFDPATKTLRVSLARAHGLKPGDLVRLITDDRMVEEKVTAVLDEKTFEVGTVVTAPQRVFVYGRQVDDFLAVDYNRVFTTGIGAIQELANRMEQKDAQVAALEQQVADLQKQAAQVTTLEQQMADMRKLVAQLAEAAKNSKLTAGAAALPKTLTTASLDH